MLLALAGTGALVSLHPDRGVDEMAGGSPAVRSTPMLLDPPGPPRNLQATGGDGYVDLSWDPPNTGGLPLGYRIYRDGSQIDEILLFTTYRDSGVENGVTYCYTVTAWNLDGESGHSNEDCATPGGPPPPPPPTVPGPPKNLNAVAGDAKVDLTWQAPENDGGSPITNYHIYRGSSPDQLNRYATVGGDVLSYTDTGVTNGQTYWYRVSAENDVGEGEKSNAVSATPEAPPSPPGPPVDLRATPGDGEVQLDWSAPTDDGGAPIENYTIYRGTTSGQLSRLVKIPDVLTYLDTGVTNGQKYFYQVSAHNSAGEGPRSTEVSATPMSSDTVPDPPTDLAAVGGDARVSLSWQAPAYDGGSPITNYKIYRGPSSNAEEWLDTVDADTLSYIDTQVTNGVPYFYYVTAVNIVGESGRSNEVSATPTPAPTVPDAVRNLTAEPIDRGVVLRWQPPAHSGGKPITNYKVYRGFSAGDRSTVFTIGNVTTHTDLGLQNGKRYYYVVAARNEVGDGPPSNEASAVPATVPTEPRNLRAFPGDSVVTLQWSGPRDHGGSPVTNYRIYRGTVPTILNFRAMVGPIDTFKDENLLNDQTYYYQVSAVNRAGEGPKSTPEVSATPHAGSTVPGPPPTLIATAGNGSVRLTWSVPEDDGGSPILRYSVYRDVDPDNLTFHANAGNSKDFLDVSVTNGVTYYYEVAAVNGVGEGPRSPLASATPHEGAGEGPDLTSPRVTITNPPPDSDDLTAGPLDVYGTARDDISVIRVEVSPDGATWTTAIGTAEWAARILLTREGLWTIHARVVDSSNNTGVATVTVTVKPGGPGQQGGPIGNPGTMMIALAVGSFAVSAAVAWFILDRRRRFWKSVLYGRGPPRSLLIDESLEEQGPSESGPHPHRRSAPDHRLRP